MRKSLIVAMGLLAFTFSTAIAQEQGEVANQENPELQVGDDAPDWQLTGSDGKVYKLSDYQGKQAVVVAWYPAALTGG